MKNDQDKKSGFYINEHCYDKFAILMWKHYLQWQSGDEH